jgi:hypothetical protein
MLLWQGIGRWLVRNPRSGRLFGAVSISDAYKPMSRSLIARWAGRHLRFRGAFPLQVVPRRPFPAPLEGEARNLPGLLEDFDALDEAIALIEGDKGVPVLFKHYARLGGRFAGFNSDPAFGDVLDGLVVVDLASADVRLLGAYMGKGEALGFQARHKRGQTPSMPSGCAGGGCPCPAPCRPPSRPGWWRGPRSARAAWPRT